MRTGGKTRNFWFACSWNLLLKSAKVSCRWCLTRIQTRGRLPSNVFSIRGSSKTAAPFRIHCSSIRIKSSLPTSSLSRRWSMVDFKTLKSSSRTLSAFKTMRSCCLFQAIIFLVTVRTEADRSQLYKPELNNKLRTEKSPLRSQVRPLFTNSDKVTLRRNEQSADRSDKN